MHEELCAECGAPLEWVEGFIADEDGNPEEIVVLLCSIDYLHDTELEFDD